VVFIKRGKESKMSLQDKSINVPTLNQEKAIYYPEESVKASIKELITNIQSSFDNLEEWDCLNMAIKMDLVKSFGPKLCDIEEDGEQ
jgi:hypothetical protein